MSDIQQMAKRLGELERVKTDMTRYNHPDDARAANALALKYIAGTSYHDAAVSAIAAGMDEMIRATREQMREALK